LNEALFRPWAEGSFNPNLAQVFFRRRPSENPESSNFNGFYISDPSASLNDPDIHRKSVFKLRANGEWGEAPETQAASGFAGI